jgi:hypothetical protein
VRVGFGVFAAAVLALAACGSSQSSTPSKESGLQEYQSSQALADDLTKHGHTCNMAPEGGSNYAVDGGKCTIDGTEMILGIYASQSQIDAQLSLSGIFESAHLDYGWLAGKNWVINCESRAACEKIGADLGGSVVAPVLSPTSAAPT